MKTQKRHIFWFILIRAIAVTSILVAVVIIQSSTSAFIPVLLCCLSVFPVAGASVIIRTRAAYITAGLSAILFGLLVDGLYFGVIPYFSPDQYRERSLGLVLFTMFLAWSLIFLIAFLANYLTYNLRKAREELLLAQKELEIKERLATPGRQVFSWVNLPEILEETLTLLRSSGELDGRHLLAGNYASAKVDYYGNPNQFKQVFWNLAKNALKAMPGGGTLTVDFFQDKKKSLRIRFGDTGRGLTEEEKQRLFEPFFSRFENGHGLGLVVVRGIVDD